MDGVIVLVSGWQHKSLLTLYLSDFGDIHSSALEDGFRCCSSCDHLLQLYYRNDYLHMKIEDFLYQKLASPL